MKGIGHLIAISGVALAVIVLLPTCSSDTLVTDAVPAKNATTAPSLPTLADALPDMDVSGFHALMDQLKGTPVVVNYWAAWCNPCKAEVPLLEDSHARYGGRVQFIGVDMQDFRSSARSFIQSERMTYPSVFDPLNKIGLFYDLFSPPMTQFVDADGTVVATVRGQISAEALQSNLKAIAP